MSIEQKIFLFVMLPIYLLGIITGYSISQCQIETRIREEAVKHNAAQYNPKNGKFEWKEFKKND